MVTEPSWREEKVEKIMKSPIICCECPLSRYHKKKFLIGCSKVIKALTFAIHLYFPSCMTFLFLLSLWLLSPSPTFHDGLCCKNNMLLSILVPPTKFLDAFFSFIKFWWISSFSFFNFPFRFARRSPPRVSLSFSFWRDLTIFLRFSFFLAIKSESLHNSLKEH